jgi:hypothetical protein
MAIHTLRIGMESEPLARGVLNLGAALQVATAAGDLVVAPQQAGSPAK